MIFKIDTLGGYFSRGPIGLSSIFGEKNLRSIKRYITEFLPSAASHGAFTDDIVLSGDFRVKIKHSSTETAAIILLGRTDSTDDIFYTQDNNLRLRIAAGSFLNFGSAPGVTLSDGKIHTTEITRVSNTITATTDGVAYPVTPVISDPFTVNALADRQGSLYWDGTLLDLEIEDNGTLVVDCPLNESPSIPYFANRAATLGSELVTDNTSGTWVNSRAGSITNVANGIRAIANITGTQGAVYPLTGLTVGRSYVVSFSTASDGTTGAVFPRAATDQGLTTNNQGLTGSYPVEETTNVTGIFTAITATMYVGAVRTIPEVGTYLEMTGMTIREIPAATPYITKENIADAQTVIYDQVSDGWEGPNVFDFADASASGSATKRADDFYFNWESAASAVVAQANILSLGGIYRWNLTISEYVQGELAENSSGFNPIGITGNGSYVVDTNPVISTTFNISRSGTTGEMSLKVNSAKRFLEVA